MVCICFSKQNKTIKKEKKCQKRIKSTIRRDNSEMLLGSTYMHTDPDTEF